VVPCGVLNRSSIQQPSFLLIQQSPSQNAPIQTVTCKKDFLTTPLSSTNYQPNHVRIRPTNGFVELLVLDSIEHFLDILDIFSDILGVDQFNNAKVSMWGLDVGAILSEDIEIEWYENSRLL
jgi:hypothetical protein